MLFLVVMVINLTKYINLTNVQLSFFLVNAMGWQILGPFFI